MYSAKVSQILDTIPVLMITKGAMKTSSISTVLTIILPLACLLILLVLKYELTRLLKVLEKSEALFWANFGLLILVLFIIYCLNTEVKNSKYPERNNLSEELNYLNIANVHLNIPGTPQ